MPPTNRRPHLVECGPGNNTSVLAGIDNSGYPTKSVFNQEQSRAQLRRKRQVRHLWRCGEQALFYFLSEIEAGACIPGTLETYAKIDPAFVAALGGSQFPPILHCIDGDGP